MGDWLPLACADGCMRGRFRGRGSGVRAARPLNGSAARCQSVLGQIIEPQIAPDARQTRLALSGNAVGSISDHGAKGQNFIKREEHQQEVK